MTVQKNNLINIIFKSTDVLDWMKWNFQLIVKNKNATRHKQLHMNYTKKKQLV